MVGTSLGVAWTYMACLALWITIGLTCVDWADVGGTCLCVAWTYIAVAYLDLWITISLAGVGGTCLGLALIYKGVTYLGLGITNFFL